MPNIFDFNEVHSDRLLEELAEQIEGTLRCIAYADKCYDLEYINEAKKYYERVTKRGELFKIVGVYGRVESAYYRLMDLGNYRDKKYISPENIASDAEDIIFDELYCEPQVLDELEEYEKEIYGGD